MFTGPSALAMDVKGRLAMPTRYREPLMALCGGRLTLTKDRAGCLMLIPEPTWLAMRDALLKLPMEAAGWRRFMLGSAQELEMDSAGRLLIAPELRTYANLHRDLMLMGVGRHFELWDAATYALDEAKTRASEMPDSVKSFVF
ncbi:MAG: division/cell wall cluster transcriptional repressor MraZ [Burkholderiales bacterium]